MSQNDELHGLYFEDLKSGQTALYARTVTEADIVLFAGISGDTNPVHINEEFASETIVLRPHRPRHADRELDRRR